MNLDPSELKILELVKHKADEKAIVNQNWIIAVCQQQINEMEAMIVKLRKLMKLCENPDVVVGIELFVGRK